MNSLYIKNFKNVKEMTIPQLRRVNLVVGKNCVGKSSLLEAIAIYLSKGDESTMKEILADRGEYFDFRNVDSGKAFQTKGHYLSFFREWEENYSKDFYIAVGENPQDAIKIRQVYIQRYKEAEGNVIVKVFAEEELNGESADAINGQGIVVENKGRVSVISYERESSSMLYARNSKPFQMIHTLDFDSEMNAILFDKVSLSTDEKYVIEALNIINPQIDRISFVSEGERNRARIPVVSLKSNGKRVKLSSMGDGVNRVLTIILSLLNAKGNVLLLDEFETGLHYSVQKRLWEIIFMLSEKLNIQVIVTSHSSDCLRSFAKVNVTGDGMLIRLEERKAGIFPVCYTDNDDIEFAADNDIELR